MKIEEAVEILMASVEASASECATSREEVESGIREGVEAINTLLAWNTTGHHVDLPVALEFSEATDEDGLPLYERRIEREV